MDEQQRIARDIFTQHGLALETAQRAGGWTNAVWFNGDVVLRLSCIKGNDRIRREIQLAKLLPPSVGYPPTIGSGVTEGFEWSLSKRIQGRNLSDVWGELGWPERATAVRQIFDMTSAAHSVDLNAAGRLALRRSWYNPFIAEESLADIKRYVAQGIFTDRQGRALHSILERFYDCLGSAAFVLNHGDITTDNLLWHEGNVVSLMDFEHSAIAPSQLDLHSLVNLALIPDDVILTADSRPEAGQYIRDMMVLFKPLLPTKRDGDLLLGYSVLFRQRFLEFWLEKPEGEIGQSDAYQKLISLSDGHGGYLAGLIGQ